MSKPALEFTAHFKWGKLHGQEMKISRPGTHLSIPHYSYPGRHTHSIRYRLERVDGKDCFYTPDFPHVREVSPVLTSPLEDR